MLRMSLMLLCVLLLMLIITIILLIILHIQMLLLLLFLVCVFDDDDLNTITHTLCVVLLIIIVHVMCTIQWQVSLHLRSARVRTFHTLKLHHDVLTACAHAVYTCVDVCESGLLKQQQKIAAFQ